MIPISFIIPNQRQHYLSSTFVFTEHKTENGYIKLKLKIIKCEPMRRKGENSSYQLISELTFLIFYKKFSFYCNWLTSKEKFHSRKKISCWLNGGSGISERGRTPNSQLNFFLYLLMIIIRQSQGMASQKFFFNISQKEQKIHTKITLENSTYLGLG